MCEGGRDAYVQVDVDSYDITLITGIAGGDVICRDHAEALALDLLQACQAVDLWKSTQLSTARQLVRAIATRSPRPG